MSTRPLETAADAVALAERHWANGKGYKTMSIGARACLALLEGGPYAKLSQVTGPAIGVALLASLGEGSQRSRKTVALYYSAFRRALRLAGCDTPQWPKPPTPPRKTRERIQPDAVASIIGWLDSQNLGPSADLVRVLRGTGLRISVEGLSPDAVRVSEGADFSVLHIRGKGGHERTIPVVLDDARAILRDPERLGHIRATSYEIHRRRFKRAVEALGITSKLATPHAIRHAYANGAYEASGGNLVMVQELLGHADPATTARYLGVDLTAKAEVLKGGL